MKYVIFSDVHGNQYALRQMIQDTQQIADGYLYLGDTSGYYYGQKECKKLLQSLPNAVLLKGNHDCNYVKSRGDEGLKQEYAAQYGNSYLCNQGTDYSRWLEGLDVQANLELGGIKIGMFHGSLQDAENGRCYPDSGLDMLQYASYDVVLQGHTHYRMARMVGDTLGLMEHLETGKSYRAPHPYGCTLVVNPGSLGQPRDGKGFSYCIFDFKKLKFSFHTVQFDKEALIREIREQNETEKNERYLISVLERDEKKGKDI